MLAGLDLDPGMSIHLAPEAPHTANWYMTHMLARKLMERGCQVILVPGVETAPPAPPPDSLAQEPIVEESQDASEEEDELNEDEDELGEGDDGGDGEGQGDDEDQGDADEEEDQGDGEGDDADDQSAENEGPSEEAEGGAAEVTTPAVVSSGEMQLSLPTQGNLLTFRLVKFGITYTSVKRAWFVGPKEFQRIAEVRLQGTLVREPGHVLLGAACGDQVAIDSFPGQARSILEGHAYPFEIVQPPEKSIARFVEPVFVAAIISGLVYLFSENQK